MRVKTNWLLLVLLLCMGSCTRVLQPGNVTYEQYHIAANQAKDTALQALMQPYRDSVDRSMNEVVGTAEATLEKAQPAGSLGNFMADAVLAMAAQKFNTKVDAAIINYGGIRSNQLAQGAVTKGKVFELMPFDNLLVLQKLSGAQMQQLLDYLAVHGGWPVAGISMQIKNKKAIDILINGQALQADKEYILANSDYVANGGDGAAFLKAIPQISNGYLIRDALFDYIKSLNKDGKPIYNNTEMRIRHAQ